MNKRLTWPLVAWLTVTGACAGEEPRAPVGLDRGDVAVDAADAAQLDVDGRDVDGLDAAVSDVRASDAVPLDAAEDGAASSSDAVDATDAAEDTASPPPAEPPETIGGDRPARVLVPDGYADAGPWPLVILLHGYTVTGSFQDTYFGLSERRDERGFVAVIPEGTRDTAGQPFWAATEACCDHYNAGVDDVAYLNGLIDEALATLAVDPDRVYLLGHSNGGFMSYRMACESNGRLAAIASLAGASFADHDDCRGADPVAVLQIHGTMDAVVSYYGGFIYANRYPSALRSVSHWAEHNACPGDRESGDGRDLDALLFGAETTVRRWTGCAGGTSVELWSIYGGSHFPTLRADATDQILDFLFAHRRAAP